MKKSFKVITLILAIAMLAVSLCSCRALDEAKANQAVYSDDHTEIEYRGNIYRLLFPKYHLMDYYGCSTIAYASDKDDVPVLLSSWYGDRLQISEDETIIRAMIPTDEIADLIDDEELYYDTMLNWHGAYYIREDRYDEVKEHGNPL